MTKVEINGASGSKAGAEHPAALRFGLLIALAILVADQIHKWWMINIYGIKLEERIHITPFMDFIYVLNKGGSYGMFTQESSTGQVLLAIFAFVVSAVLAVWLRLGRHGRWAVIGIGLIIGGAVGNGIDRLHLGGVADFIQLHAFGFYWYVFNIADVSNVAGVLALLYDTIFSPAGGAAKRS